MSWEQLLPQANTKMTTLSDFYQPQQGDNELKVLHAADLLDQRQARQIQMKVAKLQFDTSVEHLEGTKALSAIAKPQQTSPDDIKTAVGYVPQAQYMSWAAMYKGEAANQQQEAMTAATQAAIALQAGRMQYMVRQGIDPEQVGINFGSPQPQPSPQGQDASVNIMATPQTPPATPTNISAMSQGQTPQQPPQMTPNPAAGISNVFNIPKPQASMAPSNLMGNVPQGVATPRPSPQASPNIALPSMRPTPNQQPADIGMNPQELATFSRSQIIQRAQLEGLPLAEAKKVADDVIAQRGGGGGGGQPSGPPSVRNSQAQQFVSKIVAANGDIEKLRKLRNDPIAMSTWGGKKLNDAINDAWKGGKGETGAQEKAEFLKTQAKINLKQYVSPEEMAKHDAYKQEKEIIHQALLRAYRQGRKDAKKGGLK